MGGEQVAFHSIIVSANTRDMGGLSLCWQRCQRVVGFQNIGEHADIILECFLACFSATPLVRFSPPLWISQTHSVPHWAFPILEPSVDKINACLIRVGLECQPIATVLWIFNIINHLNFQLFSALFVGLTNWKTFTSWEIMIILSLLTTVSLYLPKHWATYHGQVVHEVEWFWYKSQGLCENY